jgi:hypothetical protein
MSEARAAGNGDPKPKYAASWPRAPPDMGTYEAIGPGDTYCGRVSS